MTTTLHIHGTVEILKLLMRSEDSNESELPVNTALHIHWTVEILKLLIRSLKILMSRNDHDPLHK